MRRLQIQRFSFLLGPFVVILIAGCGSGRYPVTGKVSYEDGSPLVEGNVVGEATVNGKLVSVQGNVGKDGTFAWGGEKAGDGALPGNYRVIVLPRGLGDSEVSEGILPAVEKKFTSFETSEITFEVKNKKNELNIKVTKPSRIPK
jgi:hypothetical protein